MFNSIDGHQSTHNPKGHVVGGDAPHTLAFIVSSVSKELHTTRTQTLQSEANFTKQHPEVRKAGLPKRALSEEPVADRECGQSR